MASLRTNGLLIFFGVASNANVTLVDWSLQDDHLKAGPEELAELSNR